MQEIELYLSKQFHCQIEDLHKKGIIVTKKESHESYLQILAYQEATVVCCSYDYYDKVKEIINSKSRDEAFELPWVYGQTLHYVYDSNKPKSLHLFEDFQYQCIEDNIEDYLFFSNAVDKKTKQVVIAKKDDKVVAIAGASVINDFIYELGVDVIEDYRHQNLGSQLIRILSTKLVLENKIPIYSASTTNIASQRLADKSGYKVVWVDTFGVVNDSFDAYKNIRK